MLYIGMGFKLRLTDENGGTYEHDLGAAGVSVDKTFETRSDRVPWLEIHRWTVDFRLRKEVGGDSIDTKVQALEEALRKEYVKAEMLYADNSVSSTVLSGSRLLGTVRPVKPPSYLRYQGGEHVTYKTGTYQLEGVIKVYQNSSDIVAWEEEVSSNPVGEVYDMLQPNVGNAVRQRVREKQFSSLIQSGTITHAAEWGDVPDPILDEGQLGPVRIRKLRPRFTINDLPTGRIRLGCPTQYEYRFASSTDLDEDPTEWE